VYSMGTEDRRPAHEYLPPNPKPYEYIVFRATEVKDLVVERRAEEIKAALQASSEGVHQDPAVIGASTGAPRQGAAVPQDQPVPQQQPQPPPIVDVPPPATTAPAPPVAAPPPTAPPVVDDTEELTAGATARPPKATNGQGQARLPTPRTTSRDGSIRSAEVAVESVERAMDQLRVSEQTGGSGHRDARRSAGRRGGHGGGRGGGIKGPGVVPETPFDFLRANAKFDKTAIAPEGGDTNSEFTGSGNSPASDGALQTPAAAAANAQGSYYDKSRSFFDDISSDSKARSEEATVGGRGGSQFARQRREEERNRNLSTFGEAGIRRGSGPRRGGRGRGRGAIA